MWINDGYYKELLKALTLLANGSFDFDQSQLRKYEGKKYTDITQSLIAIKENSQQQADQAATMMSSVIYGNYQPVDTKEIPLYGYTAFYEKYNDLIFHLETMRENIREIKKSIVQKGRVNESITIDNFRGKWRELIMDINLVLESLATPINEITTVINSVARGDLSKKMRLKIDDFEITGDLFNLATTINTMVDQLALFASEVTRVAKEVGTDGLLGGQAKVDGVSGTWLDLTNNVNGMADSLTSQVRNIADVTTAVARGDLSQKITVDAKGEILELKGTINTMVDQLALFASEVTRVAKEVGTDGLLGGQAKVDGVSGTWLDLTNNVNGMAESLTSQVRNIADVTTAVAKGDLSQKITVDAKGEILELKKTINTMVDQLALFASEVTRVAKEVGTDGLLGGQAKVDGVSGTWLDLTNNVNGMAESLTSQVRNIADVTTAVAKGDLSQKITVDAKGEILELKKTINTMVDQLALFASEVTRVAKEVGTDGLLGGQAKVDGVSGTWLDLTNNVNDMAESLTAQVRNIANVTTSVAKGDLSQKITVNAKGEILELKETINTMVDQLAQFASEVTRVAKEVGTDGLLGGQAKVDGVSGTWLDLTNNVNDMAESLTAQVRNVANVTTAVAKGDLSQKITVDAKGEILELKGTINTMVDQLALFASEVTRVAKEVGTDGLLGGQAEVDGVSGTWLDLTNNVNGMAESLTLQVRNIIEVAIAVASGDLTRKIDINLKGEFQELKENINTMIQVLSDSDTKNRDKNWIKDGVSLINKKVLDKNSLKEQVEIAIIELARYVNAGMGALYIYNTQTETLQLKSSYAYTKRNKLSNEYKIGEGVVGQVAYERKPILLNNTEDMPAISTALTEYKALNTYTSPLIFKDQLIGVVELASSKPFNDIQIEYFQSVFAILSGSLYASLQTSSTRNLLVQSQTQSKELKEQSLKLKHQNEELEEQSIKLEKQRIELEKKNKDLKEAKIEVSRIKEIELANKYKSEFLANMSHELRTPLNSMLLLSNSLANSKKLDLEKVNKQASIIYDAGNSLLSLINDVLDLSKIEANLMSLNIEKIEIEPLLDELQQLFSPQAEEKQLELIFTVEDEISPDFATDRIKLTQILKNFISNAIKFTEENGKIRIVAGRNNEEDKAERPVKIAVIDNGIGIEKDKTDLIFEAFRQADGSTSRKFGGTGLGLSISKEFAALLGGRIAVQSTVGAGSTFTLYLPKETDTKGTNAHLVEHITDDTNEQENVSETVTSKQREKKEEHQPEPEEASIPQKISKKDTLIMVVDDDNFFSGILTEKIREVGCKVIQVHDGNTAISLAREYQPKAIFLDLVLPGLDGMHVLKVLKADSNTRHIPVKIISFNDPDMTLNRIGAVESLKKPMSEEALEKAISSLVDFTSNQKRDILVIQEEGGELAELLSDENIEVITANSTEQGFDKAEGIDCIVIDICLKNIDTSKLVDSITQRGIKQPVIVYAPDSLEKKKLEDICQKARNIILKIATSRERLIEEVSLFLHANSSFFTGEKKELLHNALNKDELLYKKRILIVDDDVKNIFALSAILEEKGISIVSALNGEEALNIVGNEEEEFDAIFMDIMMPVMDGYKTIKEMRKIERLKSTPIIALTAKAQKEDKQKCLNAGANDYMTKPTDYEQLLHLLKVWTKKMAVCCSADKTL